MNFYAKATLIWDGGSNMNTERLELLSFKLSCGTIIVVSSKKTRKRYKLLL